MTEKNNDCMNRTLRFSEMFFSVSFYYFRLNISFSFDTSWPLIGAKDHHNGYSGIVPLYFTSHCAVSILHCTKAPPAGPNCKMQMWSAPWAKMARFEAAGSLS